MRIWCSALGVAGAAVAASIMLASAGASPDSWSAPATLATCGAARQPKVVFPFKAPDELVGSGAIVWLGACGAGTGATIGIADLGGDDRPQAPRALLAGAAARTRLVPPLYALGTATGEIVAVAGSAGASVLGSPEAVAADGVASADVERLRPLGGPDTPLATMDGFIGDADVATIAGSADGGYEIVVRAQRHYAKALHGRRILPVGSARPSALALGMDFRADRLVVWAQRGQIWAQDITNDGRIRARQLLGPSGYAPQIAAVLSDDNRAFVIWTDEPPPGAGGATQILLAHSRSLATLVVAVAISGVFSQLYFGPLFAVPVQMFGLRNAGFISGFGNGFANLGAFTFIFLLGVIRDATGSFNAGFDAIAGACMVGVLATAALARERSRERRASGGSVVGDAAG